MKKLLIIALLLGAAARIGSAYEKTSAPSDNAGADDKKEVLEKAETFLENAYGGFVVCVEKCKDCVSGLLS